MLQLCTSQQISNTPYTFRATGIRVYSIEEALYHTYHHWRESVEDVASAKITAWVANLGHFQLAEKIKGLASLEPFSKRMLAFLSIIEYFDNAELAGIKSDLESWEHRVEWERLKDRADHLVAKGEPAKALPLYRQASKYEENSQGNAQLINNMAIAHMLLGNYKDAVKLLAKAHASQPENHAISLHYAEAAILSGEYDTAKGILQNSHPATPDVLFLHGLMAYQQGDYHEAIAWLEKAASAGLAPVKPVTRSIEPPGQPRKMREGAADLKANCYMNTPQARYIKMIADAYVQLGHYEKALASLDQSAADYHVKAAEIYAVQGHSHMPEAIHHMRKALEDAGTINSDVHASQDCESQAALWTKLARYYRLDYDWQRAGEAIANALIADSNVPLNATIQLENARIKKGLGRMRDYRAGLSEVLMGLKDKYWGGE